MDFWAKNQDYGPKKNFHFFTLTMFWPRCGARAVSRKTPIYFMQMCIFLRNVIFITLATAIMIYEAGVEKEASHESHEVSVTALPKMPPPDNFEPSRGCLFCNCSFGSSYLCICVFDIQPVNCQCFY